MWANKQGPVSLIKQHDANANFLTQVAQPSAAIGDIVHQFSTIVQYITMQISLFWV